MLGVVVAQSREVLTVICHPPTIPNDRSSINGLRPLIDVNDKPRCNLLKRRAFLYE